MNLNKEQIQAIEHNEGPMLVLAGAGSGKTRVITERISNLIEKGVNSHNILAVTFTNKASKEMRDRISLELGEEFTRNLWVGTFHSICVRILRMNIELLGRNKNFVIYDSSDQQKVILDALKELNFDTKTYTPYSVLSQISKLKNSNVVAKDYWEFNLNHSERRIANLYKKYQDALEKNNAFDFDDLLCFTVKLLKEHPECLEYYQNKFKYVLVDEYQDTNPLQYEIITMLVKKHRNICVVGDVDQSIYSFRNADFRIILNFKIDYPDAKVIKLTKNYRSTKNIISVANNIIENNKSRFEKELETDNEKGEKVKVYQAYSEIEEVNFITNEIERLVNSGSSYNDFTILYRTNAQSSLFEEVFIQRNIPHQVVGGFRFYERREVKDLISYLKVIYNPFDSVSLQRIINVPKRGIGNTTISKLLDVASYHNISLWDVLNSEQFENLSKRTIGLIKEFVEVLKNLQEISKDIQPSFLIRLILDNTGYLEELRKEDEKEHKPDKSSKEDNVYQLLNSAINFEESEKDSLTLDNYLNHISLFSDIDYFKEHVDKVRLMTIHTSKGLEFPIVFITGLEEKIFPHFRSMESPNELEEERRLMYVASTRAKKLLYLTFAKTRLLYGCTQFQKPSRFIFECPQEYIYAYQPNIFARNFNNNENSFSSTRRINSFENIKSAIDNEYDKKVKPSFKSNFREGQRIKTIKFGEGNITQIKGTDKKTLLIINFDNEPGFKIIDPSITEVSKI